MKKVVFGGILTTILVISSICIHGSAKSQYDDLFMANLEALCWQETPNGIVYDCNNEVCIVFDYKNRFLVGGCKAAAGYTCTVAKTDWPDINF